MAAPIIQSVGATSGAGTTDTIELYRAEIRVTQTVTATRPET